jgi:putative ABC transport system permease protein
MPKMKRFTYINSFTSGLNAYDKTYMYTSIEALQSLLGKEEATYDGIHVHSNDAFVDIQKLRTYLGNSASVIGWWQQNGNFFAAMKMEKTALFIVLMLIILVASLNIISSLLMTVMSRRKEIALLLSMGATVKEIKSIFLRVGTIIGFSGIITGTILGFFGYWLLDKFDIVTLPADVYGSANEEGQIGFLNDLRRMNVAITRARMKLIILGDASTLTKHPFYKKLYEYILALQE